VSVEHPDAPLTDLETLTTVAHVVLVSARPHVLDTSGRDAESMLRDIGRARQG
jgi:hypothetical protein